MPTELGVNLTDRRRASRRIGASTSTSRGSTRGSSSSPSDQSDDIARRLEKEGVRVVRGRGRLDGPDRVVVTEPDGAESTLDADAVLLATGAAPRTLPDRPAGR